jgi:vacuolar-type H+-ATPase subunit H
MSFNLVQKDGLKLFAGFAICALVLVMGNNSTWNVFADTCTTSCGNTGATVHISTAIANAEATYVKEVTDAYNNHDNSVKQAVQVFLATENSNPTNAETQFDNAVEKAKLDLNASLMKAQTDYETMQYQIESLWVADETT